MDILKIEKGVNHVFDCKMVTMINNRGIEIQTREREHKVVVP